MKIVYLFPHFAHRAGTERILIDKMNYLAEEYGYDVTMLTNEQGSHPVAFPLSDKVRRVDLDVRFYPLYEHNRLVRQALWMQRERLLSQRYNAFMAKLRPDIVVTTTYYANLLKLVAQCPTPMVKLMESHIDRRFILSNDPINRKSWLRWLHMVKDMRTVVTCARKCNLLIALNHSDAEDWGQFLPTTVISNVVHLNTTGFYTTQNSKRVIFAGRFTEQKGIDDLFRIWQLVYESRPDWHLDVYGDGELRPWMEQQAENLQCNIHIHQATHDVFECYMQSSIFVLTSRYEPFGLVIPEAMSCGLPVVSFDCPSGPPDIITDGVDGFLVRNRDVEFFATRVVQLIDSREQRLTMGRHAIASAQRYSVDLIMPRWKSLFEQLVGQENEKKG